MPDRIPSVVERTRELTDRPFGINFIIAEFEDLDTSEADRAGTRQQLETAIAERVDAIVLFWGDPAPFVEDAHRSGVKVLIQIGSVEEAKAPADAGVDAVIAQGFEAGGHVRGTTPIWELLPATVEAVRPVPVLASGGIGDGAGVARALELGGQGVSLGTRFVASDEAWFHPAYKQCIVEAGPDDLVYADLYHVWWPGPGPHRTLRNKTFDEWDAAGRPPKGERPGEGTSIGTRRLMDGDLGPWPRYAIGVITPEFEGDLTYAPMWAGESIAVVNDIKPAAQIVSELVRDAEVALAEAPTA